MPLPRISGPGVLMAHMEDKVQDTSTEGRLLGLCDLALDRTVPGESQASEVSPMGQVGIITS